MYIYNIYILYIYIYIYYLALQEKKIRESKLDCFRGTGGNQVYM